MQVPRPRSVIWDSSLAHRQSPLAIVANRRALLLAAATLPLELPLVLFHIDFDVHVGVDGLRFDRLGLGLGLGLRIAHRPVLPLEPAIQPWPPVEEPDHQADHQADHDGGTEAFFRAHAAVILTHARYSSSVGADPSHHSTGGYTRTRGAA